MLMNKQTRNKSIAVFRLNVQYYYFRLIRDKLSSPKRNLNMSIVGISSAITESTQHIHLSISEVALWWNQQTIYQQGYWYIPWIWYDMPRTVHSKARPGFAGKWNFSSTTLSYPLVVVHLGEFYHSCLSPQRLIKGLNLLYSVRK